MSKKERLRKKVTERINQIQNQKVKKFIDILYARKYDFWINEINLICADIRDKGTFGAVSILGFVIHCEEEEIGVEGFLINTIECVYDDVIYGKDNYENGDYLSEEEIENAEETINNLEEEFKGVSQLFKETTIVRGDDELCEKIYLDSENMKKKDVATKYSICADSVEYAIERYLGEINKMSKEEKHKVEVEEKINQIKNPNIKKFVEILEKKGYDISLVTDNMIYADLRDNDTVDVLAVIRFTVHIDTKTIENENCLIDYSEKIHDNSGWSDSLYLTEEEVENAKETIEKIELEHQDFSLYYKEKAIIRHDNELCEKIYNDSEKMKTKYVAEKYKMSADSIRYAIDRYLNRYW